MLGYKASQLIWMDHHKSQLSQLQRTEVVHDIWLAPPGSVRSRGHSGFDHTRIEKEIIQLGLANRLESFLGKRFDVSQIRKLQRQHRQAVRCGVKCQVVVRPLGSLGVAGAQDEFVRFGFCEKLLYQLETLEIEGWSVIHAQELVGWTRATDKARRCAGSHNRLCCKACHIRCQAQKICCKDRLG